MDISVVVWVHNNEETIPELYARLSTVFGEQDRSYELIFVNDASGDGSWSLLKELNRQDPHVKSINFRRFYGHTAGLQAGFDAAKGDLVLTIGASLENNPEDLLNLITHLEEGGYDVVCGFRRNKWKGKAFRKMVSDVANKVVSKIVGHDFKDVTTPVRVMRKDVLSHMRLYGDSHLYLPALATVYGAKFKEVDVDYNAPKGKVLPNADILKPHRTILDLIALKFLTSFSTAPFSTSPIRIFGSAGILSLFFGMLGLSYLFFDKFYYAHEIGSRPLLLVAVVLILIGVQFIVMGLLGELLTRIYFESQNKKTYAIKEQVQ